MAVGFSSLVGTSSSVTTAQLSSRSSSSKSSSELASPASATTDPKEASATKKTASEEKDGVVLSSSDQQYVSQLKASDKRVKAHEMAHLMAAGGYAKGGPSYQYRQGPDGKKYAVAGEVQIDSGQESSPSQTIAKMKIVQRAALAPADPSPQDRRVAAQASRNIALASQEMRLEETTAEKDKTAAETQKDKTNALPGSGEASTKEQETGDVTSSPAGQKGPKAYASTVGRSQDPSLVNLLA